MKTNCNPVSPERNLITRRQFLRNTAAALTAGAGLATALPSAFAARRNKRLPIPNQSGIDHIVVVMMENRSFDHFLGWLPNADGMQSGLSYQDDDGTIHSTAPLAPDYMGCAHPDPDHTWFGGRVQYANGAMDGFLKSGANDDYAIGY